MALTEISELSAEGFGKFAKAEGRVRFTTNAWFRFFEMAVSCPIRFVITTLGPCSIIQTALMK